MAATAYAKTVEKYLEKHANVINLAGASTVKAMLMLSTYAEAGATDEFVSDIVASEATGYTRATMTSVTVAIVGSEVEVDCADFTFTAVQTGQTLEGVAFYIDVGTDATNILLAYCTRAGGTVASNGEDVNVTIDASGFCKFAY